MTIRLDHTIVPAKDKMASAEFFAEIFGLTAKPGYFAQVQVNESLTLDFADEPEPWGGPGPLHTLQQTTAEPGFFLTDFCMAQRIPELRQFLFDSPAAEIAARAMRSQRVNFFYDAIWVKEQGTPKRTRWHQDQPYYPIDGTQMSVCWTPLDPVARDVCLELVHGSHRSSRLWVLPAGLARHGRAAPVPLGAVH